MKIIQKQNFDWICFVPIPLLGYLNLTNVFCIFFIFKQSNRFLWLHFKYQVARSRQSEPLSFSFSLFSLCFHCCSLGVCLSGWLGGLSVWQLGVAAAPRAAIFHRRAYVLCQRCRRRSRSNCQSESQLVRQTNRLFVCSSCVLHATASPHPSSAIVVSICPWDSFYHTARPSVWCPRSWVISTCIPAWTCLHLTFRWFTRLNKAHFQLACI